VTSGLVRTEPVMGTVASFQVFPGDLPEAEVARAVDAACALLHRLDDMFSTWQPDSPINQLRAGRLDPADTPPEVPVVLELCREAKELSAGWFDPWALPGGVDPTGLVKGWAVEQAVGLLAKRGVPAALLGAGGDIATLGRPPDAATWRIGIRHPWRRDALACVIGITGAIATSGRYERGDHLTNPHDGSVPRTVASATVIGDRLGIADALATAVAVGGDEALAAVRSVPGYEVYLIRSDGTESATDGVTFAAPEAVAGCPVCV
jgi:thiamine biosynthesis lipoprotein